MSAEVVSRTLAEQPTAVIRGTLPLAEVGNWLPNAYAELFGPGVTPAGPPFARYTMHDDVFTIEAGCPVATPVTAHGRVEPSSLPGGTAAVLLHTGPYDQLGAALATVQEWLRAQGYRQSGDHWEIYLNGPPDVPDAAQWKTEVVVPYRPDGDGPS
jgi:effector-binding domain-containing protein